MSEMGNYEKTTVHRDLAEKSREIFLESLRKNRGKDYTEDEWKIVSAEMKLFNIDYENEVQNFIEE